jgi:hypothetical protein
LLWLVVLCVCGITGRRWHDHQDIAKRLLCHVDSDEVRFGLDYCTNLKIRLGAAMKAVFVLSTLLVTLSIACSRSTPVQPTETAPLVTPPAAQPGMIRTDRIVDDIGSGAGDCGKFDPGACLPATFTVTAEDGSTISGVCLTGAPVYDFRALINCDVEHGTGRFAGTTGADGDRFLVSTDGTFIWTHFDVATAKTLDVTLLFRAPLLLPVTEAFLSEGTVDAKLEKNNPDSSCQTVRFKGRLPELGKSTGTLSYCLP